MGGYGIGAWGWRGGWGAAHGGMGRASGAPIVDLGVRVHPVVDDREEVPVGDVDPLLRGGCDTVSQIRP